MYTLARFVQLTDKRAEFDLAPGSGQVVRAGLKVDLIVEQNIVLRNYGDQLDRQELAKSVNLVMDLHNQGYSAMVRSHIHILSTRAKSEELTVETCADLLTLRNYQPSKKLRVGDHLALFGALNRNLSKNSTGLRKATLEVLTRLFATEPFLESHDKATVDLDQVKRFYKGECAILTKLLEYENIKLAFETERTRESILRNIQV